MWIALAVLLATVLLFLVINPQQRPTRRDAIMRAMNSETSSSYQQTTNHSKPPEISMGPITGSESHHRVNLHQAYIT